MNNDFWLERWEKNEIGFHQDEINPHLEAFWNNLDVDPGCEVFVPLCGKSRDMLWLRNHEHPVLGVELSDIASKAFFDEAGMNPVRSRLGKFEAYEAEGIRILCGDFFDLSREDLAGVGAVYDRASLVALPPELRKSYADHLAGILPHGAAILLLTFDYPQEEMQGPPFSVSPDEVRVLYGAEFEVGMLAEMDTLEENPRFRKRGLTSLRENVFGIVHRD